MIKKIWQYRYYIFSSIHGEFRARFTRSKLGGLWLLIHPLAQAAIFALVLSKLMSARLPGAAHSQYAYPVYLLSGMIGWTLFTDVLSRSVSLFVRHGELIKKISFPHICLPLIAIGCAVVNNILLTLATLFVCTLLGFSPGLSMVWIPVLILIISGFSLGIGIILGIFNVFIRDIDQIIPIFLQLAFWFTPIVYVVDIIPLSLRPLLKLNPMLPVVESFQHIFLFNQPPNLSNIGILAGFASITLALSFFLYHKAKPEMVNVL